jgi:hypothetical protein
LHPSAPAAYCHGEQHADQSDDRSRTADARVIADTAAENISADSGCDIHEEVARRAVRLFNQRADVHQNPHVEDDVQDAAMKENRGDQPPRLGQVISQRKRLTKDQQDAAVDSTESEDAHKAGCRRNKATLADRRKQAHDIQQAAQGQDCVGNGRRGRHELPQRLARGGQGKREACATLVTARHGRSDKSSARRAEFRSRRFATAAKNVARFLANLIESPAQTGREWQ